MGFAGDPLTRSVGRTVLSLLLVALSGFFWWYGVSTNRLAARDLGFLKNHFWLVQPFSEAWVLKGNVAYYVDLDPQAAAVNYRQAIAKKPLAIEAWLNLAKVGLAEDREEQARRILETLSPLISHVSTWKWQELLLARDLQEETLFAAAFNFILTRLPLHITEASFLAKGLWGDSRGVISHVAETNREVYFAELLRAGDYDAALTLWKTMETGRVPPDRNLRLRFCQALITGNRLAAAKEVWANWRDDGQQTVYDGGFEGKPTGQAFGWSFRRNPDVVIERSTETPFEGSYALHLRFMGTKNVVFSDVRQDIPVEPGKVYLLRFARRTQGLTSDQGVYLEVVGYHCQGLRVMSEPVLKRSPWLKEELLVPVPSGCEVIVLRVRRDESLMFDSKISGDYWLDAVELIQRHDP